MPLIKNSSKPAFKKNVETLMHEVGKSPHVKSREQALAIAYSVKRRGRAMGGPMMPPAMPVKSPTGVVGAPLASPAAAAGVGVNTSMGGARPFKSGGTPGIPSVPGIPKLGTKLTTGPLVSAVPGRTDKHFGHVPSGAYVIPADIVSGRGQGNTLAGMNALHNMFRMDSAGKSAIKNFPSRPVGSAHFKKGGSDHHTGKPVDVMLAGGEVIISPEHVLETMERLHKKKGLTLDAAHKLMDKWVIDERKKLIKELKKLPSPARD